MTDYCTLADARAEIKATGTTDDAIARRAIRVVSRRIDKEMGAKRSYFAPYLEQRKFRITADRINTWDGVFWLNNHILAFTAVLKGTETVTTSVELYSEDNKVTQGLRFTDNCSTWYSGEPRPVFVYVTGTWGWHEDWDNAWDAVDKVKDAAGITDSVTTITVDDVDGEDLDDFTPRFSAGNLIRIGTEYIDVLSTDTDANTMTVRRGVNGSTASAHALNDDIYVYRVDDRIRRITARQAAVIYARRGAFQVETLDGVGATYPQDLMPELLNTLTGFIYG